MGCPPILPPPPTPPPPPPPPEPRFRPLPARPPPPPPMMPPPPREGGSGAGIMGGIICDARGVRSSVTPILLSCSSVSVLPSAPRAASLRAKSRHHQHDHHHHLPTVMIMASVCAWFGQRRRYQSRPWTPPTDHIYQLQRAMTTSSWRPISQSRPCTVHTLPTVQTLPYSAYSASSSIAYSTYSAHATSTVHTLPVPQSQFRTARTLSFDEKRPPHNPHVSRQSGSEAGGRQEGGRRGRGEGGAV